MPLLLFILVPLAELAILIKLGEVIGIAATIALVISTAVIGVSMLKRQGLAALSRARADVATGEFPVESVVDGACLLVAGAFLLTPGLLTDTAGFLLLIPGVRRALARWLFNKLMASGHVHAGGFDAGGGGRGREPPAAGGPVLEGEYRELDDSETGNKGKARNKSGRPGSPWRK